MGGDSGLKHVVHKRVHLERPQPASRKRLGYLEKHKDYVKRAKDFHVKEDKLKRLHRKAYFRNKDEFAFGMVSHKVNEDGKTVKKRKEMSQEEQMLLDSQDARYIAMREQIDRKAIEKKAASLHFLDADRPNKHTLFLDEDEIARYARGGSSSSTAGQKLPPKLKDFAPNAYFDTHPLVLGRKANRLTTKQLEKLKVHDSPAVAESVQAEYQELLDRQERVKKLRRVREEIELQRHLRGKGKKTKVADATANRPAIYRWAQERKR